MGDKIDIEEIQNVLAKADLLYTERDVSEALDEMAVAITQRLLEKQPLCLSVMIGEIGRAHV